MRTKTLPHIVRDILRLYYQKQLSIRSIARSVGIHRDTVSRFISHFGEISSDIDEINSFSDDELYQHLNLKQQAEHKIKPHPDWSWVHSEMRHSQMTLETLWREWRETKPDGIAYSQFVKYYRKYKKSLPLTMRQIHIPGEKLFLDFAGKTVPVFIDGENKPRHAQIFVAVLGYSNYTYACAVWRQSEEDWLRCHVKAFDYFSGSPKFLVPDNLKAAVIKHRKEFVELNAQYQRLAHYYQTIILPARPRKPKDKAKVEAGVKLIQRWLLNTFRYQKFFSLEELNQAISDQLIYFNQKRFKGLQKGSRLSLFNEFEKPELIPLPEQPYENGEWKRYVKVRSDYLVEFDGHHYSVPYRLINQQVSIRGREKIVEIYHNNLRICSHVRVYKTGMSIIDEHRPPNHKHYVENGPAKLLAWAENSGRAVHEHIKYHLMERKDVANGYKAAHAIRKEAEVYGNKCLEEACDYALRIGTKDLSRLRSILKERPYQKLSLKAPIQRNIDHENLRGAKYFVKDREELEC